MPAHEQVIDDITKEAISSIDTKSLFEGFWSSAPPEFSLIFSLTKYLLIAFLIYVIISIIVKLFSLGINKKIKVIANNIIEINEKLDLLVGKLRKAEKKEGKKKEER